jgi:hypothetical protein
MVCDALCQLQRIKLLELFNTGREISPVYVVLHLLPLLIQSSIVNYHLSSVVLITAACQHPDNLASLVNIAG